MGFESRSSSSLLHHESQACYHSAIQSPQFDVSFPKKLLKIVATRGEIFSLKFTKYCLAEEEKGGERKGREGRGGEIKGRDGEGEGRRLVPPR